MKYYCITALMLFCLSLSFFRIFCVPPPRKQGDATFAGFVHIISYVFYLIYLPHYVILVIRKHDKSVAFKNIEKIIQDIDTYVQESNSKVPEECTIKLVLCKYFGEEESLFVHVQYLKYVKLTAPKIYIILFYSLSHRSNQIVSQYISICFILGTLAQICRLMQIIVFSFL